MLTLISREIRDHMAYLLGLCLVTAMTIAVLIGAAYVGVWSFGAPLALLACVLLVGYCVLGAAQMYGDRANRISPLLATLAVTRSRILAARVAVGVLAVLISLAPLAVTTTILVSVLAPPLAFYRRLLVEISLTALLTGMACYCVGLLLGWTTSKSRLLAGSTLPVGLLVSLVWIKGLGPDVMALLLLFIGATLWCLWRTFTSVSL